MDLSLLLIAPGDHHRHPGQLRDRDRVHPDRSRFAALAEAAHHPL